MASIRVGVQLHPQQVSYETFASAVQQIEQLGVDTIWDWDHFFPLYGDPQGNHFEGWTLLTAMATLTSRVEIGCLVTCNNYRNPALLSNMAKTVDHISGGRLILGIGAGWFERDYREFGYEFGTAPDRLRALRDALPIIKQRWQVDVPAPIRNPIPICIGGSGEKVTLKLVAQHADIWNSFSPAATYHRKNEILNDWCREVGRNPAEIERSILINPHEIDQLDDFVASGATHILIGMGAPFGLDVVEKLVKWRDSRA